MLGFIQYRPLFVMFSIAIPAKRARLKVKGVFGKKKCKYSRLLLANQEFAGTEKEDKGDGLHSEWHYIGSSEHLHILLRQGLSPTAPYRYAVLLF